MQHNAHIYGLETFIEVLAAKWFMVKATYNYLRGEQSDDTNLPFIPQNKFRLETKFFSDVLWKMKHPYIKADMLVASKQNHPAIFETSTNGYVIFNAALGLTFHVARQPLNLELVATNIFDTQYYDHLSTLKPFGYFDPGRGVMVYLAVPLMFSRNR
jgi:iron complex outermembrane receptor protein